MALQLWLMPASMAGPPLVTDDPGILDPGSWEIIIAITGEDRPSGIVTHAPLVDISLGLSTNTQISFYLPHHVTKPKNNTSQKGLGFASMGYKWRVLSTDNWEWAIASNYTFPVSHEIIREDGPDDIRVLGVPLLVSRSAGDWTWTAQMGWNVGSDGSRFWDYGVAVSHPLSDSMQWMIEVFGSAASLLENNTLGYHLGVDYEMNPALHILASAGSRIKSDAVTDERLNNSFYLGLQWFH